MKIEWNKVTWYSKLAAIVLFVAVLVLGIYLGREWEKLEIPKSSTQTYQIYPLVQSKIEQGEQVKYNHSIEVKNIPSDVYPEQIEDKLTLGNVIFAFVMQPDDWNNIPRGQQNMPLSDVKWAGVLASIDNGQTWQKYFTINNPKDEDGYTVALNPVGMFIAGKKIFVDVADDRGGGSGEGEMTRLQSSDGGKTWQKAGCYYFVPENYYVPQSYDRQSITPDKLETSNDCIY